MVLPKPQVTSCLIVIQETYNKLVYSFDAYLESIFRKKYYIGLGQEYLKYHIKNHNKGLNKSIIYPIIQIDHSNRTALKCPTISGNDVSLENVEPNHLFKKVLVGYLISNGVCRAN